MQFNKIDRSKASLAGLVMFAVAVPVWAAGPSAEAEKNWPAWRGPHNNGVATKAKPPVEWSESKNIRWKVEIPGKGHATPIVWGDRVYVQTAIEMKEDGSGGSDGGEAEGGLSPMPAPHRDSSMEVLDAQPDQPRPRRPGGRRGGGFGRGQAAPKNAYRFEVIALDRKTGKTIWTTTVKEEKPHEAGHTDATQASNSPVTDGEHIYAFFGSRGLHCLTLDGKLKWSKDLGKMQTRNQFGEGSSPALHGDTIVVQWDHEGDDFIAAFNKKTGEEIWRVARDEHTSWCTPLVIDVGGRAQVVAVAQNHICAYDLKTGREIWRCGGMTANTIPSPMVDGDLLYCISGFRGAAALAIRYASAKGDITDSPAIAWKYERDTPYVPSAVICGRNLYFIDNNRPLISCIDKKTGEPVYEKQRLSGIDGVYASLLAADGRVYVAGRNGTTIVLKDGPEMNVLATNKLDDGFDASPVAVGNELFLRGRSHLYCIAEK